MGFGPVSGGISQTAGDARYQPLENQRLGSTSDVTFGSVNTGVLNSATDLISSIAGEYAINVAADYEITAGGTYTVTAVNLASVIAGTFRVETTGTSSIESTNIDINSQGTMVGGYFSIYAGLGASNTAFSVYTGVTGSGINNAVGIGMNAVPGQKLSVAGSAYFPSGIIQQYNGITLVNNGVPSQVATSSLTAQGAAISATTIHAAAASGLYRVSFVASITRAATTSSALGGTNGFQIKFTDPNDSVVKTTSTTMFITSAGNTTGTVIAGTALVNAKAGTNIQYLIDYTSVGVTSMQYDLSVMVEKL